MYSGRRLYFWLAVLIAAVLVLVLADSYIFLIIVATYFVLVSAAVTFAALRNRDRDLYQTKTLILTPGAFSFRSPKYNETFDWEKGVSSYRRLGPYHLIYFATGGFVVLPDRDIPADMRDEALALFHAKV